MLYSYVSVLTNGVGMDGLIETKCRSEMALFGCGKQMNEIAAGCGLRADAEAVP